MNWQESKDSFQICIPNTVKHLGWNVLQKEASGSQQVTIFAERLHFRCLTVL